MEKYENGVPKLTFTNLRRPQLEPPKPKRSLTPFLAGMIAVIALSTLTSRMREQEHDAPPSPALPTEQEDSAAGEPSSDVPKEQDSGAFYPKA